MSANSLSTDLLPSRYSMVYGSLIIVNDKAASQNPFHSSFASKEALPPLRLMRQADCRSCRQRQNTSRVFYNRSIPNHDRWSNDFATCAKPKMPLRNHDADTTERNIEPAVRMHQSQTPCDLILEEALRIMKSCSPESSRAPCMFALGTAGSFLVNIIPLYIFHIITMYVN